VPTCVPGLVAVRVCCRLDWAPNGSYVMACNSFQSPSHTAPVVDRATWSTTHSVVGHKAPVVVVRHNPKFFSRHAEPADKAGGHKG
jgi:hypothetical protein